MLETWEKKLLFGPKKENDKGDPRLTPSFEIYINNQTSSRKLKVEVHVN